MGDGACDYASNTSCPAKTTPPVTPTSCLGKILRITRDGGIPSTNPYTGADSARCNLTGRTDPGKKCQETFASGLRNPFRFAFDPNASGTRFFVNDVGEARWEEMTEGRSGADYAWNLCEGAHDNPNMPGSVNCSASPYTPPIHEYSHDTGCSSVTGAAFVPNGVWPAGYDNSYLFGDFVCGKIFRLTPDGSGGFTRTDFVTGLGSNGVVAMTFGPHQGGQALYYTTYNADRGRRRSSAPHRLYRHHQPHTHRLPIGEPYLRPSAPHGRLRRLGEQRPRRGGHPELPLGLRRRLADPDDHRPDDEPHLLHQGHIHRLAARKGQPRRPLGPRHGAHRRGQPGALPLDRLAFRDLLFRVGQQITLSGSATDPEDGQLPASSFEWEVLQHHNGSPHPPLLLGHRQQPDHHRANAGGPPLYRRRQLPGDKVHRNRLRGALQDGHPRSCSPAAWTSPSPPTRAACRYRSTARRFAAPRTLVSWEGYTLTVNASSPQTLPGTTYAFSSWSDGKGQQHSVVTGATPSVYTAAFKACTKTGTTGADVLDGTSGADVICGLGGNDTVRGLGGNDDLEGMGGDDVLRGGAGADKIKAGLGADGLYGDGGNDALDSKDGVSGNDTLDGGAGTDTRTTDATERSIVGFP